MKSSNNQTIKFMMILGLFTFLLSGCQPTTSPVNSNMSANSNTPANANTEVAKANTNAEAPKVNTNTENSNTGVAAAPKPDNCPGPGDNEVIVFEHIFSENGGGKCVVLKPGEYKNPAEIGLANDSMSSIKVGVNVRATVCTNDNFGTPCEEFDKTDDDLTNNPTIKNDTASSIKVVEVKAESKPEAVKALANGLAGEWTDGREINKFTEDKVEFKFIKDVKPYNTTPYKVVDGKTVEFTDDRGKANKAVMTFEDNGNTLIWYRPDLGRTFRFKRVNPK